MLITGCARGMGAAAARRAAREGANVIGVDWLEELGAHTPNVPGPMSGFLAPWTFIENPEIRGVPGENIEDHLRKKPPASS